MYRLLADSVSFAERQIKMLPEGEVLIVCGAEWAWDAYCRFEGPIVVLEREPGKLRTLLERHPEMEEVEMHLYDSALEPFVDSECAFVGDAEEARETLYWLKNTWREHLDFGEVFYTHFFRNLKQDLFDWRHLRFPGVPAVICGAGPSLDRFDLPEALIFAAGSALPALASRGIHPHFAVGVDPNPAQFQRIMMQTAFEVPLLFHPRMHSRAVEAHQGPCLYVGGGGGYPVTRWCEEQLGIAGPELDEGYNCVHMAVELARQMGCNPIILAGVDLAFTDGQAYARGVEGLGYDEEVIECRGVKTLRTWRAESQWMSDYARRHPEIDFYNATGAGLGIEGIPHGMPKIARCDPVVELRPLECRDVDVVGQLRKSLDRCRKLEEGPLGWFELEEEVAYTLMVAPLLEARARCRGELDRWAYVQKAVERLDEILAQ